jgi:hypothetical protein
VVFPLEQHDALSARMLRQGSGLVVMKKIVVIFLLCILFGLMAVGQFSLTPVPRAPICKPICV